MPNPDPLFAWRDLPRAAMLLTRLPVRGADGTRAAASAWAWPVIGIVVGGLAGIMASFVLWLGLPVTIAAGLALATMLFVTGALHADGLADCADGFWGGQDADRRLTIMKDSQIGTFGALALLFWMGSAWALLAVLIAADALWVSVILPAVISRAAMVAVMAGMEFARQDGLARHVGRPGRTTALLAVLIAIGISVFALGTPAIWVILVAAAAAGALATLAQAKIGGQTGDVLGACQLLTELAVLLALAVVLLP